MKRALLLGSALALLMGSTVFAQVADVPRNETLVLTPWGDQPAQFANVENWNPYLTSVTHQRDAMQFTVNEMLFYTNLNTGELIPWQAESFEYAPDFMSATIKLTSSAEMIVTGIARMKLPRIPLTNASGRKLSVAVSVAAIIARPIFCAAVRTATLRLVLRRRAVSIASTMMMVSSTIRLSPRISANNVMTFSVYPSK